jgi:hypothetical protein
VFISSYSEAMLLTTNEDCRLRGRSFDAINCTSWRAVNLELWIPYIFITHAAQEDFGWISSTTIFWIDDDIISFCKTHADNNEQKISNISLLLPEESDDGKSKWRWLQIEEVWSCPIPDSTVTYPIYISIEKERIAGVGGVAVATDQKAELLYRSRNRGPT